MSAVFATTLALCDPLLAHELLCDATSALQTAGSFVLSTMACAARALYEQALCSAATLFSSLVRRRLLPTVVLWLVHRRLLLAVAVAVDATWSDIAFIDSRDATLWSSAALLSVRSFARFPSSALLCFIGGVRLCVYVFLFMCLCSFCFQRTVVDAVGGVLQRLARGVQQALTPLRVGALFLAQWFGSAEGVDIVVRNYANADADVVARNDTVANANATRDVSFVVVVCVVAFALLVPLVACFCLCMGKRKRRDGEPDVELGASSSLPPPSTSTSSATALTARDDNDGRSFNGGVDGTRPAHDPDDDVDDKVPLKANT